MVYQRVGAVSHQILHLYLQRVLIDEGGVAQPVEDGVLVQAGISNEGIVGVEVQPVEDGKLRITVGKIESQLIGLCTLCLDKVAAVLNSGKGQQGNVVGHEMGIGHPQDVGNVKRVTPDGVLPDVGFPRRLIGFVVEGHHLALLVIDEVTVSVLQGKGAVGAWCHSLHHKVSAAVGARDTYHWLLSEDGVREVVIESHEDALDRLQILGIKHIA